MGLYEIRHCESCNRDDQFCQWKDCEYCSRDHWYCLDFEDCAMYQNSSFNDYIKWKRLRYGIIRNYSKVVMDTYQQFDSLNNIVAIECHNCKAKVEVRS